MSYLSQRISQCQQESRRAPYRPRVVTVMATAAALAVALMPAAVLLEAEELAEEGGEGVSARESCWRHYCRGRYSRVLIVGVVVVKGTWFRSLLYARMERREEKFGVARGHHLPLSATGSARASSQSWGVGARGDVG